MADLPDRRTLFAVGRRSIVTASSTRINQNVVDIEGSDLNLIIGAMSLMGEEDIAALAACMRGLFVETAENDALDRWAFDRYQLTRLPASPASVDLTLSRPSAAFGGFTYPAGSRVQTPDGTQFSTNADVVFGALTLSAEVAATALVSGPDSNVPAVTLTQFVDQPADVTLTVTNPAGAAGGVDAETDPEYRARILAFFPTVRRGTLSAIEFGARQVAGVAVARAYEVTNQCGAEALPACMVDLIVADKDGGFSSFMLQQVRDIMLQYRAAGIPVVVSGGQVVNQPVVWKLSARGLSFQTGIDQVAAQSDVRAVSVAVAQFLRPGETLLRSSIIAAARAIPGVIVGDEALVTPVGDTVPAPPMENTKVIRIRSIDVSFVTG